MKRRITRRRPGRSEELAFVKAQRQALQVLAERLLNVEALQSFALPEDAVLGTLIQDFEIQNERVAPTRYIASMTFRFVPAAVRDFLGQENINLEALSAHSVLVLPFMNADGKNILWETENQWLAAWKRMTHRVSGVLITVPQGHALDVESASGDAVLSGDTAAIDKLLDRYGAQEAVVLIAQGITPGKPLAIEVFQFVAGELNRTATLEVVTNGLEDPAAIMELGVGEVRTYLEKQQAALAGERAAQPQQTDMFVRAVFSSVAEWTEIQRRLDLVPNLQNVVMSLSQADAGLTFNWRGDIASLGAALSEQGLLLDTPVSGEGGVFSYEVRLGGQ